MADAFEQAAFDAQPGELVGPVESEFGYHLIRVEARASEAVQIADLAYDLSPGQATLTDLETQLADLAYFAEESGNFQEEAQRLDMNMQEVQVEAGQSSIPGIGQSRALANFTETAQSGEISEVVELDDQFAVVHVEEITPEGYRSFESVKSQIRPRVVLQKKRAILADRMRRALQQNGFSGLPAALNTQMRSKADVTYSTETIPGIGTDPSFAGTVFGLDEGQTSSVVEGENAAYVVRVNQIQEPGELTQAERQKIRQQIIRQERKQVSSQWIAALKEEATIEDNRGAFQ
jgi:peptidylprolyl isomerase/peptidyl-prolyl cis-trans isomerase D